MSQLSSGGRKNRNSGSKTDKKFLYGLAAFAGVCLIIAIICICVMLTVKKSPVIGSDSNFLNKSEEKEIVELNKKYFTNGLKIEEVKYSEGEIVEFYDYGDNLCQYEVSYERISGLKNSKIQAKINQDIEDTVNLYKEKLAENPQYDRIAILSSVVGNYSDVLSVVVDYTLIKNEEDDVKYETDCIGLNYRLDNGEKLKFQDMFFKDTNIKNILNNAAYEAYAFEHAFNVDDDFDMDFENTDYGKIENQTFKILAEYNKNPDVNFYFSATSIFTKIKDMTIQIDMQKYSDNIAVYTKYIADDLYKDDSIRKEFFAFTELYLTECFEIENIKGSNFYYEILRYPENEGKNVEVQEKVKSAIDEKLKKYYEIAARNPDKGYLVSVIYFYDTQEDSVEKYYQYDGYVVETDIKYFNTHRNDIISEARKEVRGETWCYDYSSYDENVEFYEEFSAHTEDYTSNNVEENIVTKADREAMELEWAEYENNYEDTYEDT